MISLEAIYFLQFIQIPYQFGTSVPFQLIHTSYNNFIIDLRMEVGQRLLNLYLFTTFTTFTFKAYQKYNNSDNYFSAMLTFIDDPFTQFLIYNLIISFAVIVYKSSVSLFYVQIKQNETMVRTVLPQKLIQKLWYKIFDLFIFLYITRANFGIMMFASVIIIFISFILHNYAIFRSNFLIHTHSFGSLNLHFRVLAHFLLLIFIDIEVISSTFMWFFRDGDDQAVYVLFVYYTTSIAMSIAEPFVVFFINFYERYTENTISNSDEWEAFLSVIINVPRLILQILMALVITIKFGFTFFLLLTIIELSIELSKTIKNYLKIQKLTQTMKNLKQLSSRDLETMHDTTCMICFRQMKEGTILPCQHAFHVDCLRQWIIKNSNHFCPKCKKSFNFDNPQLKQRKENVQQIEPPIERIQRQQSADKLVDKYDPLGMNKQKNEQPFKQQSKIQKFQLGSQSIKEKSQQNFQVSRNFKKKSQLGSIPYGLPTQAVYHRTKKMMKRRQQMMQTNKKLIKLMQLQPQKQILFVPQA